VHVSLRRTAAAALAAAVAVPALVSVAPSASAAPVVALTGLYGTTDPTYDGVYRQSIAILGLHAAGRTPRPEAVQWLLSQQCADGSFTSYRSIAAACPPFDPNTFTGGADSNATATAAEALFALGTPTAKAAATRAAAYLERVQLGDGSWEFNPGNSGSGDPNSTGLVLLALDAAGLAPTHAVAPYVAGLQVGRTNFAGTPAADRGAISTSFAPGVPNLLATVQTVPALSGAALSRIPDLSSAWQDGATAYPAVPAATAVGVAGWAASQLAGAVATAGPTAFAATDATDAAWAVLSFATSRTSETTARDLESAIEGLPAVSSPATNGQDALAAAAVGRASAAGVFADRIDASITRDTAAPDTSWRLLSASPFAGQTVTLARTALTDAFWPRSRLSVVVSWGDGSTQRVAATATTVAHRYYAVGSHAVTVRVSDPSGNGRTRGAGTVVVRADLAAPSARVVTPRIPSRRSAWRPVVVTASDAGSGVAVVRVRISQQRKGAWVSWNGRRWVAGTAVWVTAVRTTGTRRWAVTTPALTLGRLVVAARATDRAGLVSAQSTSSVTLRS
jgi:hypothetical protein